MDFGYYLFGLVLVWLAGFVVGVTHGVNKTLSQLRAYMAKQKKASIEDLNPNKYT